MSKAKFCPQCGSKLNSNDRYCGHCRFDTESLENAETKNLKRENIPLSDNPLSSKATPDMKNDPPLQSYATPKKDGSKKGLIIVLAVLAGLLIVGAILFWWFSYGNQILNPEGGSIARENKQTLLELPSYSLNEGSYTGEQNLSINKPSGQGVQIFYTIDGTDPTNQSILYENPILLKENTTLKSIAIDENGNQSSIKSASYVITIPAPAAPVPQANPTPQADPAPTYSESDERAQFESNINGCWQVQDDSGWVNYFDFYNGQLYIGDGGSDWYAGSYTYDIVPGNNGAVGTIYAGPYTFYIDCNPLGDNAIYIDGYWASYCQF